MSLTPDTPESTREYFQVQVQPLFSNLMSKLITNRPEDIPEFVLKYFQRCNQPPKDSSDSDEDSDRFEEIS